MERTLEKTSSEHIQNLRKTVLNQVLEGALYVPLHGKHSTHPEEEPFDLAEKIKQFFVFDESNSSDPRVMLLMGDTGSGKSIFVQHIYHQLWKSYASGNPIPLRIPLPELDDPFENAVEEILTQYGFSKSQIDEIRAKEKFIFMVDGYDELHQFQNCYVTNKWSNWKAKVLITCRSQAVYYQKDYEKYFTPFQGEKRLPWLLRKLYVAAFSREQISAYIKQYQQLSPENIIVEEDFAKVSGLTELITTPFLLHLAVESLPTILASQQHQEKNPAMTQAALYDVFIERWFTRQAAKLCATGHLKIEDKDPKPEFWNYCKKLAQQMHEKEVSVIPYQAQKSSGRLFAQLQKNKWESFFNEETEVIRSACPLRRFGDHYYGFMHSSMIEYFSTRAMYEEIQGNKVGREVNEDENKEKEDEFSVLHETDQPVGGIHQRLFALERQGIQFLADRIGMSEAFKQKMLRIVAASKKSSRYAIGAANAITALVRKGVTFNGANLAGIQIPGADLSGGYFDQVDLSHADLRHVHLSRSWLRQAVLRDCQLEGVNFGEYTWFKHDNAVDSIVYRPDLNILLTASDKKIMIWNCKTEECVKVLEGHTDYVKSVSMSMDGQRVASGSLDKTVRVWEVSSGEYIVLQGHEGEVTSVHLSADGQRVASGSFDKTVRVWEVSSGESTVLEGHTDYVKSVSMSMDGQRVASGSRDNTVRVWEVSSGESKVLRGHEGEVWSVHLSADGQRVASGSRDNTVRVWEVSSGESKVLRGHEDDVWSVHLSADGQRIVSGSGDKAVRVWEVSSGKSTVQRGHEGSVLSVYLSEDGQRVASGSGDGKVRLWEVASGESSKLRGHESEVTSVHLSADGQRVASGSLDKTVRVWEVSSGESTVLRGHEHKVSSVHLSADGHRVASGSQPDKTMRVWEVASGECILLHRNGTYVYGVALSANGQWVFWGGDNEVQAREVPHGRRMLQSYKGLVECVHLSANGQWVASGSDDYTVQVCEVASGKFTVLQGHERMVKSVHLSTDGQWVASCSSDMTVRVWKVSSGEFSVLRGHEGKVVSVHLSADGQRVFSGSEDKTVRVWKVATQTQIGILRLYSKINSISLHDASGLLAIGSEDGSVQLWQSVDNRWKSWQFKWSSSCPNPILSVLGCDFSGSQGLSSENQRLLDQREATLVPHWGTAKRTGSPLYNQANDKVDILEVNDAESEEKVMSNENLSVNEVQSDNISEEQREKCHCCAMM